jgi:urease subunit gamma/beta
VPLTPGEGDRLLLHVQASLAQRRRDRGLMLNVPEATALIADAVCEGARDGKSLPEVLADARDLLGPGDVLDGVAEALTEVRVEARFDDGTRLVVVKDPFGPVGEAGEGSSAPPTDATIEIANEAATDIGLTSHIHLAEVNPRLRLDRAAAYGMRLAVPAGETVWIRAGERVELPVARIRGDRVVVGNTGLIDGSLDDPAVRDRALITLRECGYLDVVDGQPLGDSDSAESAVPGLMARRRDAEGTS